MGSPRLSETTLYLPTIATLSGIIVCSSVAADTPILDGCSANRNYAIVVEKSPLHSSTPVLGALSDPPVHIRPHLRRKSASEWGDADSGETLHRPLRCGIGLGSTLGAAETEVQHPGHFLQLRSRVPLLTPLIPPIPAPPKSSRSYVPTTQAWKSRII